MSKLEEEIELSYLKACMAIGKGKYNEMKKLVEECPECIKNADFLNGTLLHKAASQGTPEIIEYLVKKGGDIDRIENEWSPICSAVSEGKIENVKKLIELGAELKGDVSVSNPLLSAIYNNNHEIAKILIDAGIDLTYQFKSRNNPWWDTLSYAQYYKRPEIIKMIEDKIEEDGIRIEDIPPKLEDDNADEVEDDDMIEDDGEDIIEYMEKYLGDFDNEIEEIVPGSKVWIDINVINPTEERNYITLVTTGVSEYPMACVEGDYKYAELIMKLPSDWKLDKESWNNEEYYWPIKMMRLLGHSVHLSDGYINEKLILPHGKADEKPYPFSKDTLLSSLMVCKSEDIPPYVFEDGTKIDYFTLVPITKEEEQLVEEKGSNEVMHMLKSKDVVDLKRKYLV